jgi:hypothetical protein
MNPSHFPYHYVSASFHVHSCHDVISHVMTQTRGLSPEGKQIGATQF